MYHGQIAEGLQTFTLENFRRLDSKLRVLVCTLAFGMGVEIPNIHQVIHWGKSKSIMSHWQEIGRAGRDGAQSKAVWYPKSTAGEDKEVFDSIKNNSDLCIRKTILEVFVFPGMDRTSLDKMDQREKCSQKCSRCVCPLCICCSHCRQKCSCYAAK